MWFISILFHLSEKKLTQGMKTPRSRIKYEIILVIDGYFFRNNLDVTYFSYLSILRCCKVSTMSGWHARASNRCCPLKLKQLTMQLALNCAHIVLNRLENRERTISKGSISDCEEIRFKIMRLGHSLKTINSFKKCTAYFLVRRGSPGFPAFWTPFLIPIMPGPIHRRGSRMRRMAFGCRSMRV